MAIGGDVEQLLALQNTFTRNSRLIEELRSSVTAELSGVRWEGPAADRFRAQWSGDFSTALRRIQEALDEASIEVSRRREALISAGS